VCDRPAFERGIYQAVGPHDIKTGYFTSVFPGHDWYTIVAYQSSISADQRRKLNLLTPTESNVSWCDGGIKLAVESLVTMGRCGYRDASAEIYVIC
jgi:hypothetical protein